MKIRYAIDHPHRREIEMVSTSGAHHKFPYDQMTPPPSASDPIRSLYVDPELASEGVTYFLAGGAEGAVLLDHVESLRRERARRPAARRFNKRASAQPVERGSHRRMHV